MRPFRLAFCLAAITAGGCAGSSPGLLGLVPESAGGCVLVNRRDAAASNAMRQVTGELRAADRLAGVGVPLTAFEQVLLIQQPGERGETAVGEGAFDWERATSELAASGWRSTSIGGVAAFCQRDGSRCVVRLSPRVLAAGTATGLEPLISVSAGRTKPLFAAQPGAARLWEALPPAAPVRALALVPTEMADAAETGIALSGAIMRATPLAGLGNLAGKLGAPRGVGASFVSEGVATRARILLLFKDETSASLVSGGLTLLKGLASLAPADVQRASAGSGQPDFSTLTVTRTRDVVALDFRVLP